jgi:hypothetical protein
MAAGTLLALPAVVRAQKAAGVRRIGVLEFAARPDPALLPGPLELGLRDLGWVEGQNLFIERRVADSHR